ncbi:MAG: hypothetical protein WCT11_04895 [Candidatus Magasanikbacteria bacterium]
MAETTLYIFRQIVGIIFALSKSHLQHKHTLRSRLAPESGEAQRNYFASVHKVDYLPAVYAVPCEPIWVPSHNADWFFAVVDFFYHFIKNFSSGTLGAFAFYKFFRNNNIFSFSEFIQL